MAETDDRSFHIDKRVPVALIVTLMLQTGAAVWWARGLSAAQQQSAIDQKRIETRVDRIEIERSEDRRSATDLTARVIRIEEKIGSQNDTLQQILRSVQDQTRNTPN